VGQAPVCYARAAGHGDPAPRAPPPVPPPCSDVGVGRHEGAERDVGQAPFMLPLHALPATCHPPWGSRTPALHRPHRRPALMRELGGMRGW
jgi:hypothetical protein